MRTWGRGLLASAITDLSTSFTMRADCKPYPMPDPNGGFLTLAIFCGEKDEPCATDGNTNCNQTIITNNYYGGAKPASNKPCGGPCGGKPAEQPKDDKECDQCNIEGKKPTRFEVVEYSGIDADGVVTLVGRGLQGTSAQSWCPGVHVLQNVEAGIGALPTEDTVVTYTFNQTNPVNGDGIIVFTATPSDGGAPQEIELPEPTVDTDTNNDWTASALSPTGILTYTGTDGDGNPIAMPPVDLNALISPMLLAGDGITLDVDPNTGAITVNSTVVDTDTDTWDDVVAVQSTDPNTGVVTTTITVTPAEGGTPVVTTIVGGTPTVTNQSVTTTNTATTATTTTTLSDGSTASDTVPIMQPTCEHTLNRPVYELAYQADLDARFKARSGAFTHSNSCLLSVQTSSNSSVAGTRVSISGSNSSSIDGTFSDGDAMIGVNATDVSMVAIKGTRTANINDSEISIYGGASNLNVTESSNNAILGSAGTTVLRGGLVGSLATSNILLEDAIGSVAIASLSADIVGDDVSQYSGVFASTGITANKNRLESKTSFILGSSGSNKILGANNGGSKGIINSRSCRQASNGLGGTLMEFSTIIDSLNTESRKPYTTVWGFGGNLPVASGTGQNMTAEMDSTTGTLSLDGAVNTGAALPGFGEYALAKKSIPAGTPVVFDGAFGVRPAKESEKADGVARDKLVMSAGGGFEPENSKYLLDENFERIMEDYTETVFDEILDKEEFNKAIKEIEKKYPDIDASKYMKTVIKNIKIDGKDSKAEFEALEEESYSKAVKAQTEAMLKELPNPEDYMIRVNKREIKVNAPKHNPKYDPNGSNLLKTGVEMLGRAVMITKDVKVGDTPNGFRVLEVLDDKRSVVLVK